MLSILHVLASINPATGGIAEGVIRYSQELERLGHRVEIATLDHCDDPWVISSPIRTVGLGPGSGPFKRMRRILPWMRYGYSPAFVPWLRANAHKYDVIVINGLWNYSTLGAWRAFRKLDVPYFVYPHGMLDPWFKRNYPLKHAAKQMFWLFSEGRLLSNANAVLFTTEDELHLANNSFFPYKKIRGIVVGYGTADVAVDSLIAAKVFFEQYHSLANKRFVLFLGRLHPKKGCDILIKAFHRVQHCFVYDIVFAGPDQIGWKEELVNLAINLGVSERVHWTGMLNGDLKWGALQACEAFILPSHQENFGVAVAEALACGKQVLITNKVNIWREVLDSDAGLVGEDTVEGIVGILEKFAEKSGDYERAEVGERARRLFLSQFEIAASTKRLVEIFGKFGGRRTKNDRQMP